MADQEDMVVGTQNHALGAHRQSARAPPVELERQFGRLGRALLDDALHCGSLQGSVCAAC